MTFDPLASRPLNTSNSKGRLWHKQDQSGPTIYNHAHFKYLWQSVFSAQLKWWGIFHKSQGHSAQKAGPELLPKAGQSGPPIILGLTGYLSTVRFWESHWPARPPPNKRVRTERCGRMGDFCFCVTGQGDCCVFCTSFFFSRAGLVIFWCFEMKYQSMFTSLPFYSKYPPSLPTSPCHSPDTRPSPQSLNGDQRLTLAITRPSPLSIWFIHELLNSCPIWNSRSQYAQLGLAFQLAASKKRHHTLVRERRVNR